MDLVIIGFYPPCVSYSLIQYIVPEVTQWSPYANEVTACTSGHSNAQQISTSFTNLDKNSLDSSIGDQYLMPLPPEKDSWIYAE